MLRPYLKIWDWDLIFDRAVKAISSPGVRSPCSNAMLYNNTETEIKMFDLHSWFDFQTPKKRKKIEKKNASTLVLVQHSSRRIGEFKLETRLSLNKMR